MSELLWKAALGAADRGWIPDALIRAGIRRLCAERLAEEEAKGPGEVEAFVERSRREPVAPVPEKANEQHYELPPEFFEIVLGARGKYSCCWWEDGARNLDEAEEHALAITCERARIADDQDILELGCGWGALTLWMAERYPNARITAVSNSAAQRRWIEAKAGVAGLRNVRVLTRDMNDFQIDETFDRVVSLEMFEHMRNHEELLRRVAGWLRPDGSLFVHIFCHRRFAYEYETGSATNWLGQHFFTGGVMPSYDLLARHNRDLRVAEDWYWNGRNYEKTAEAWLRNLDARRDDVLAVMRDVYGPRDARMWLNRWRIFFLACAGLWGYAGGEEWGVGHYRIEPAGAPKSRESERAGAPARAG